MISLKSRASKIAISSHVIIAPPSTKGATGQRSVFSFSAPPGTASYLKHSLPYLESPITAGESVVLVETFVNEELVVTGESSALKQGNFLSLP